MKILLWLIATPFIALALFVAAIFLFCGPDKEVIKVAKPVVKIIADDIVKNGIPKSFEDIEGLPYVLKECKRERTFWKAKRPRKTVQYEKDADYVVITESCSFKNNNKIYNVSLRFTQSYRFDTGHGKVKIFNSDTYTGIGASFNRSDSVYQYDPIGNGYAHHHGILCGSFKQ
jgi:hypothetical protein